MTRNPFTSFIDAQRTAIEQSQRLTHELIDAQRASFSAFEETLDASDELIERNTEVGRSIWSAYFDAVDESLPAGGPATDDLRRLVDGGFDASEEVQRQTVDSVAAAIEDSESAYEEFAAGYTELVDTSFDAVRSAHDAAEENLTDVVESVEQAAEDIDATS